MKRVVVTRRSWKSLEPILDRYVIEQLDDTEKSVIEAFNSKDFVGAKMDFKQFIEAVVLELGNPALILTQTALTQKLLEAADRVFGKMQRETKRVV